MEEILKNIRKLLFLARKRKMPLVFTKLVFKKDYSDDVLLLKRDPAIIKLGAYRENSWDSEIVKGLAPRKGERVIVKKRYDPFMNTNLERFLNENKVKKIIVAGVLTNVCVESFVRSAFDRSFETIVVKDATSTYSKKAYIASLETLKRHFAQVLSFDELVSRFEE